MPDVPQQGGVREASTFIPAGGEPHAPQGSVEMRKEWTSTASQHEWGAPHLPCWAGVRGPRGESELAPTSSHPPRRAVTGHPYPSSQKISVEAEWGVHPAAMGGTPLAADEAQGNLDFFPDLVVTSPSYSLRAQCQRKPAVRGNLNKIQIFIT